MKFITGPEPDGSSNRPLISLTSGSNSEKSVTAVVAEPQTVGGLDGAVGFRTDFDLVSAAGGLDGAVDS